MNKILIEQNIMDKKFKELDVKWRKKLEIEDEINPDILNYNIDQKVLNYFNITIPLSKILIYCDKMRKGNKFSIYNRHTYLNTQIKDFYEVIKNTMKKFDTDVHHLRQQIDDLNKFITKGKSLKNDTNPKNKMIYKKYNDKYKTKMCEKSTYEAKKNGRR